mmetsp:Transcript_18770/g.52272  ORF Transcript_18770/g.52272 Transcript_18770/m.52272 type:complete len:102 (+) Transcript_18770:110-415(+)
MYIQANSGTPVCGERDVDGFQMGAVVMVGKASVILGERKTAWAISCLADEVREKETERQPLLMWNPHVAAMHTSGGRPASATPVNVHDFLQGEAGNSGFTP